MPIYEYQCEHCGIIEVLQSIKAEVLETCPECEENKRPEQKVKKLISGGTGFILNGSC